jgi:hypothetical protein
MAQYRAYCWRGGIIEFGDRVPDGALPLDRGTERSVRKRVEPLARRAYQKGILLVPGIPEAATDVEALEAYQRFVALVRRKRLQPKLPLFRKAA